MLMFYRYKVDNGMMLLGDVPEPYQTQMRRLGYVDETEAGEGEAGGDE